MKFLKYVLPVMMLSLSAIAEDDCRVRSPEEGKGQVVNGVWVPEAASSAS